MISFGLRLTLRGGKEAVVRLVITAAAVTLGVGLLLGTLAAVNAVNAQNARFAWLNSAAPGAVAKDAPRSADPLWGAIGKDLYRDTVITRVDVAATGPSSPVPPGIPRLPGPGEFYASPAMSALLRSVPSTQLGDRYPGRQIGVIGKVALSGPDESLVIVGHRPDELSRMPDARKVDAIATKTPSGCDTCAYGTRASGIDLILSVTAAALIFPVLIFIGAATRLSAARREQRFAAMRLVGATPRQVSLVAAIESTVAAVIGTALGFGLFLLLRGPVASLPLTGSRFFASDMSLNLPDVLAVALGVPLAAALAARIALRRVRVSPLGVTRRTTPRPPRVYRVIPLLAGIGELTYFVGRRPDTTAGQAQAYLTGIFLIMGGLIVAGPWLTMAAARLMARGTSSPATLIAGRRLSDNPTAGFRAISGLVLVLFTATTAVGVMTAMTAESGTVSATATERATVVADYSDGWGGKPGVPRSSVPTLSDTLMAELHAIPGVRGVAAIHVNPLGSMVKVNTRPRHEREFVSAPPLVAGLATCAQVASMPGFGRCAAGAKVAAVPPIGWLDAAAEFVDYQTGWRAASITAADVARLPLQGVAVATDGSSAANERVRTTLTRAYPLRGQPPASLAERNGQAQGSRLLAGYQRLADVVVAVGLVIAGCGLAVSMVAGLNDRARPFSLLRLTGVRLATLRRVVLLESAAPLLVSAVVGIGTGFLAAFLFLKSQLNYSLHAPDPAFYGTVVGGVLASLGLIAATLPLLRRITGPATARNE